jgi:hypothetical protein
MLAGDGYISGADIREYSDGQCVVNRERLRITVKGLEYLHSNKMMLQMANEAKGIIRSIEQ